MHVVPLPCGLGAEVEGVDLHQDLADPTIRALERAAAEFGVLVFHGQGLTESEQLQLTRAFGDSDISHLTSKIPVTMTDPKPSAVHTGSLPDTLYWTHGPGYKDEAFPDDDQGFGRFHSDLSYQDTPLQYTILSALESTQTGGETEFVDTAAAYASLDDDLKQRLRGLQACHCHVTRSTGQAIEAIHPVVVRNPELEIDALYVNRTFTRSILGVKDEEALLEQLVTQNEQTPVRYRHKWSNQDVVLWDNFRVLHRRCGFPAGERRVLLRTQSKRQRPQAAPAT